VSVVPFSTDPNDAQTDADGLSDGEEVGSIVQRSVAFTIVTDGEPFSERLSGGNWQIHSNPTKVDTDGDGLTDDTETEGWTVPTINRSGQAYRYATHEANGSVHVDSNPRKKDSDGDVITDSAEKFRAHTDPSGDVRYGIAGTLATRAVKLDGTRDSDQDGFPDRQEFQGIPTQVNGEFTQFETDPLAPDTDGDQLHESVEFESLTTVQRDIGPTGVQRDIFPLISDPTETDSDGDRLADLTEMRLGTDPLAVDTDGDKILDFRDENPTTDDSPPAAKFNRERLDRIGGYFRITDDSEIAEIEIEAHYPGSGWQQRPRALGIIEPNERYSFGVGTYNNERADKYWVNVTDTNGNTAGYLFEFEANGEDLARTAVATGAGFAASPDPFLGDNAVGATVAVGGILFLGLSIEATSQVEAEEVTSFLAAEPVTEWEDTPVGHVTLPPGYVSTTNGQTRGRGWAYIQATSGVTQEQIGDILENGEHVPGEGLRDYVIGQAGERTVILTIIGGTLMAASADGYTNDPCDQSELVDLAYEEDHYTRNPENTPKKPFDDRSTVKRLLEDGINTAIETVSGGKRYYIKKVGPNQWTVIVLFEVTSEVAEQMKRGPGSSFTDWFVKTFLTDTDDGKQFFDSKEEARDAIQDDGKELDC
jgi:hypothetical protein